MKQEEVRLQLEAAMKIELEYMCVCGHTAAYHDPVIETLEIGYGEKKLPIKVIYQYKRCTETAQSTDPYAYTNFNSMPCNCEGFKLDNLSYLEKKADEH